MKHANIPETWTARQAVDTVAFLERVIDAIWRAHGPAMAEHLIEAPAAIRPPRLPRSRRRAPPLRRRYIDDDIPF